MAVWVLASLREYLSKEPAPIEKLEYAIAQQTAIFVNANRAKGSPAKNIHELMLFRGVWSKEGDEGSLGDILSELGAKPRSRRRKKK